MPDVWTHYFFADQVRQEQSLVIRHLDWYYLGAQGPDILFYERFQPWKSGKQGRAISRQFHQTKTDQLLRFVFDQRQQADGELADYLTGFLSHYALDSSVHPLIHRTVPDGMAHKRLEMALDGRLYQDRLGQPINQAFVPAVMAQAKDMPEAIVNFYVQLAEKVFGRSIEPELFRQSYRDFRRFHHWTNLRPAMKRRLIEGALRWATGYAHFFYGRAVAQVVIPEQLYQDYLTRFDLARDRFRDLLDQQLPEPMVNFSGYSLETV